MAQISGSAADGGARAPSRPRRRDAERNRRRLLDAARELFAERGFGVTMDDVAERAQVGVGTAYRHFVNKDELIVALSEERIAGVGAILDRALAEPDPWRAIVGYLEDWLALHAGDRGLKEIFLTSPRARRLDDEAQGRLRPRLDEVVERAKSAGVLRPGVETTDVVLVQMMLFALPASPRSGPIDPWRRFLPVLLEGIRPRDAVPLPGRAFSGAELDEAMTGILPPRR
ncbi:TetR/AcrR family transcriptional regulator [Solwaraspora sp. WMMB335]|uniref:TetR/AcrR family transcriptional regulator n=1 Tax=Solwaraspora sp. WMMB335 TaxID=3404118 RepID=UPI003B953216